jgi:hypothetical protein
MSARRTRGLAAGFAFVATVAVVGIGGSAANADPPALDPDTCANVLDRAQAWPGTLDGGVRLYSDGFDSYLGRLPVCQTGT